jgi:CBS domain-containing protein
MKARDVMQRDVITVTPETRIEDALRLMARDHISGLPVVDATGTAVGILSEGDLLRRVELGTETRLSTWRAWIAAPGREAGDYARSHARQVGEVMTAPIVSVTPDTDLAEIVALMESRRIKRIPVLENGRIAGIVTRADLVRALERLLPRVDTPAAADAELRRRLLASLAEQTWARRIPLRVKVRQGMVELDGVVIDRRERQGLRVLAENTPGVRGVIDHLVWIEPNSGIPVDPPAGA